MSANLNYSLLFVTRYSNTKKYEKIFKDMDDSILLNWTFVDNESSGGK
ncbi:MAG: hypothetical protein ACLFQA_10580 [Bacteroidales bacterium]